MTDLTVRALVTIDASGATAGGRQAAAGMDQVAAATRRAHDEAKALQQGTKATQEQMQPRGPADPYGPHAGSAYKYKQAMHELRMTYDPLYASSQRYMSSLAQIDAAQAANAISATRAAQMKERLRLSFEGTGAGAQRMVGGVNSASQALSQLSPQVNDVVGGFLMGQPVWQIATQQGGQIYQVWQQNPKVFKELGTSILGAITPMRLMIGGIGLVGVAAAAIYAKAIAHEKEMEAAVLGPGRAAGLTAGQLDMLAVTAARSSQISISSAYAMAAAYTNSGKLSGDSIRQLIEITADYAATTGQDMESAQAELLSIFSNLKTGVDELDKKLNTFAPAQRNFIKNLVDSGQSQEAVTVAIKGMTPALIDHEQKLGAIARNWEWIKRAQSNALTVPVGDTTAAELAQAKLRLAQMQTTGLDRGDGGTGPGVVASAAAIAAQQRRVQQLTTQFGEDQRKANEGAAARRSKELGEAGNPVIERLTPGFSDLQRLETQRKAVAGMMGDTGALTQNSKSVNQAADAMDALMHATLSYLTPAQRAQEQSRLEIETMRAKTPEEKAAVAVKRERLAMAGQEISASEREARVQAAAGSARAAASYQLEQQNRATNLAIEGALALADAQGKGGDEVMRVTALYQAKQEALAQGTNVEARSRQLLLQAVAGETASMQQSMQTRSRTAEIAARGNALVLSGAMAYGRLNDYVQENVELLRFEDLRKAAVLAGNTKLIGQIDEMIAKLPELAKQRRLSDAIGDIQGGMMSLSDNAAAGAQAQRYALAMRLARQWRDQTLSDIADVTDGHEQLASDIETIFADRVNQIYEDDLRRRRDWSAGIERANLDITRSQQDMASRSEGAMRDWARTGEDVFASFRRNGMRDVGQLSDFVIEQMLRMAYNRYLATSFNAVGSGILDLVGSMFGAPSTGSGGSFLDAGSSVGAWANVAHSGWDTSRGRAPASRYVHPAVFDGARRYHVGGDLASGEMPVIVEKSEKILTERQSDTVEAALSQPAMFMMPAAASSAPAITIRFLNNSGVPLKGEQGQQRQTPGGGFEIDVFVEMVEKKIADNMYRGASPVGDTIEGVYGARRSTG